MKKLITILGAGLLAFGMFTSCGAKDVNLSWSDESTSYTYTCDVTAGSIAQIVEPTSYLQQEAIKNATTVDSYAYTFKYATVSWSEGYAGKDAAKSEGNVDTYTINLYYEEEVTTTVKATNVISGKEYNRNESKTLTIKKVDDKYFVNLGADNQAEVTIDGDIEDDEFTFSVDLFTVSHPNDWNADGSTKYIQGTTVPVVKAVKNGASLSNITIVRK